LPHYYFDIETTGLDSDKDEIISIQFQKILLESGRPEAPLTILTSWEKGSSELKILEKVYPLIASPNPWKFVPVGNNLNFEFKFLLSKIARNLGIQIEPLYFHSRPHIDLKHIMILLNGGRFKGYHLILKKYVARSIIMNYNTLPKDVQELVSVLSGSRDSRKYIATAISNSFDSLPKPIQDLFFDLIKHDDVGEWVGISIAQNYDKVPKNIQQLLPSLLQKHSLVKRIKLMISSGVKFSDEVVNMVNSPGKD
jgi:hypothetical protein